MKPSKKSHIEFCQAIADGSTKETAYKTYVSPKKNLSSVSAQVEGCKMAKKYASYIAELKEKIGTAIDKAHENSVLNGTFDDIMTKAERMDILSKIARGEILVKKAIMTNQRTDFVEIEPDHMDRKNAIAELNKMDGSYAPIKNDVTLTKLGIEYDEHYIKKEDSSL